MIIYQLCTWIVGQKVSLQKLSKNDKKSSLQTEEILVAARISMFQGHRKSVLVHFVYIDHQTHTDKFAGRVSFVDLFVLSLILYVHV